MKLFFVTLTGMGGSHGRAYVVADDPTSAVNFLIDSLESRGLGYRSDRVLKTVELIADEDLYTELPRIYFTKKEEGY